MLDKKKTAALHGIAILMMIYHHLFISGNNWYINQGKSIFSVFDKIDLTGSGSAQLGFAWFCKICVAIFAFTSGYAMFKQLDKRDSFAEMLKYLPRRWWSFYKKYLLAFLFFVGASFFLTRDSFDFSLTNFILSLLGLRAGYNGTWWYVSVYYLMILISPFICVILKKIDIKTYIMIGTVFVASFFVAVIGGNLYVYLKFISMIVQNYTVIYLLIFAEGMFTARYNLVEVIGKRLNFVTSVTVLILVYVIRSVLIRDPSDSLFDLVLIAPFVIATVRILSCSDKLTAFFGYFGNYSAYMWYAHAYFYAYLFFIFVAKADMSLIVYVQVAFYSLVCSIAFTGIENRIFKRKLK